VKVKPVDPLPVAAKSYPPEKMTALFTEVDGNLRRGEIKEARESIARISELLIPVDFIGTFRQYKTDVNNFYLMLLDTSTGATIDLPWSASSSWRAAPRWSSRT